jgi:hypothetical protein
MHPVRRRYSVWTRDFVAYYGCGGLELHRHGAAVLADIGEPGLVRLLADRDRVAIAVAVSRVYVGFGDVFATGSPLPVP